MALVSINAPGATAIRINTGYGWNQPAAITDGNYEYNCTFWYDTTVFAMASYDNGATWTGLSNFVNVHAISKGQLAAPQFTINDSDVTWDGNVTWGDYLTVTIENTPISTIDGEIATGYVNYSVSMLLQEGPDDWTSIYGYIYDKNCREFLLPTFQLSENNTYRVSIRAEGDGYDGNYSYSAEFTVSARQESDGDPETYVVTKTELQTGEPTHVLIFDPDAERIEVSISRDGDLGWCDWLYGYSNTHTLSQNWQAKSAGTYTMTAYAYRSTPDTNERYEKEYPGSYKRMMGSRNVTVTAPNGSLSLPVLTDIPGVIYIEDGKDFNAAIPIDEHAETYQLHLTYEPESGGRESLIDENKAVPADLNEISLTVPAESLKPGLYCLTVNTQAQGYEEGGQEKWILMETEETKTHSISLTVNGSASDIEVYPQNKTLEVAAAVSVIDDTVPTNVRFFCDGNGYGNQWQEGYRDDQDQTVFLWYISFAAGYHSLYAQASYDGGQTWTADSNVVTANVVSLGKTKAAVLTVPESVVRGDLLSVTVEPAESGDAVPTRITLDITDSESGADLGHIFADGINEREYPITLRLPVAHLDPGSYFVRAYVSAEWYEDSSSVSQEFTVVEPVSGSFLFDMTPQIYVNEACSFSAYAPGAVSMEIYYISENDDTAILDHYCEGDTIVGTIYSRGSAGDFEYYAVAHYTDGTERESEHLTLHVLSSGKLQDPVIHADPLQTAGEGIYFTVDGLLQKNSERWNLWVYDQNEGTWIIDWSSDRYKAEETATAFAIPADLLESGRRYSINVSVDARRYESGNAGKTVFVVDGDSILILPDNLQQIESEAFAGTSASYVLIPEGVVSIRENAFPDGITICGYGGAASDYAYQNGLDYESLY